MTCDSDGLMKEGSQKPEIIVGDGGGHDGAKGGVAELDSALISIEGVVPLLGLVARAFAEQEFSDAVSVVLDVICNALGADNAEIFFSEPEGRDLLLTACRGRDREALVEQTRFEPGSGFPGRVTRDGEPISTSDLAGDSRYLRRSVVRRGVNAYACVPLRAPRELCGSLNAAWRQPPDCLEESVKLLELVASLLSTQIAARLSELRYLVDQVMESAAGESVEQRLRVLLRLIQELTEAPRAAVRLLGEEGRDVVVTEGLPECATVAIRHPSCPCATVEGGHGDFVGIGACSADEVCDCRIPPMMEHPCRLAMTYGGEVVGCVVVDFARELPEPATGELLPLLVLAQQAALHLRHDQQGISALEYDGPILGGERPLQLCCLGEFRVERQGQLIEARQFGRRNAVRLLKVLALHTGKPLSSDKIIELLFPDIDVENAKNRLHVALHSLRNVLEPEGQRGDWQLVLTRQDRYVLADEDRVWVDVAEFESLWNKVRATARSDRSKYARALETMLDLYRGDLFSDDPYDEWCARRLMYLRRIFLKATSLFVDLLVEEGEFDHAVERLQSALDIDPFDDTLNRRLIEVLLATGDRRGAQEHYEAYVRRLHEELDCEPMPATLDLGELLSLARRDFQAAYERLELSC